MIEQLKAAFPKKWERMVVIALAINNDGTIFGYDGLDGVISKKDIKIFTNITGINKILVQRRSPEERQDDYSIVTQKQIQQYIKDGSKGNLNLFKNPILSLPNNLSRVGGNLFLYGSEITSLPDNLEVEGNLVMPTGHLTRTLPKGLKVGGDLDLHSSEITSLPNDLEVGGILDLRDTPISKQYTKEQFKQMLNEFKESPRPTGHEPEKWYPFFVSWCQKFNRYISYFDFTSLIEKWYPTNSPTMSGPQGANLVIQLIECIINLISSIISLEQEDRRRGGKKKKRKQTKSKRKRRQTKKRRRTYKK
jgi:hypothetical protein